MSLNRESSPKVISVSFLTFVKAALLVLGLWFLWYIRDIVTVLILAILLAALIDPFADWFQKHKVPRAFAVIIVYAVLLAIAALVMILLIPVVVEQLSQLLGSFSTLYGQGLEGLGKLTEFTSAQGQENLSSTFQSVSQGFSNAFSSVFSTVAGVIGGIVGTVVVLVLAFYMVLEEDTARKYFKNIAPLEYQPYLSQLFVKMQKRIGAWLHGQLLLGLIIGVAVFIGLSILGVKYALLLALIAGILEVVPYIGPVVSVIPAAIIGFAESPVKGILVLILYLVIQQLENNVLVPKIMQKVTGLNPIISILALLIGAKLAGAVGAILAIPVATMIAVVIEDLFQDGRSKNV